MGICLKEDVKSAKEILDDFNKTMEMLKPYLPKIPKYEPEPKREWKIENPHTFPPIPSG